MIETTHVGSLPRPKDVSDMIFARERGEIIDQAEFDRCVARAVDQIVERQKSAGISLPSDGEMSKISYATYIKDRYTGFEGDSPRRAPADLKQYPGYLERIAKSGGTPTYRRPQCVGPIEVKDEAPLNDDISRFQTALARHGIPQGFMNSASPGVVALFQPSTYHKSHDAYLYDLADAMALEYRRIVDSGLILQIDSPDLGLGRHMMFAELDDTSYLRVAEQHVEALNHALSGIDPARVRIHVCWGNYEGPHTCDIDMAKVLPVVLRAKPRSLLFESSNPRHAHEWTVFRDCNLPEDYTLIPGCIDSTTNFVEHPELVAQRIERFASFAGHDRVIAGTDCGFSTFAGFGTIDEDIVFAKLTSLAEGARIASRRLGVYRA